MKKLLLLISGVVFALLLNAQAPEVVWHQLMGGTDGDNASDIQRTSDGGYIIAGNSDSEDGDVGTTNGRFDYWMVKLNPAGEIEWSNNFGGSDTDISNAIKQTSDGGYIMVGYTLSDDIDVTNSKGFRDAWVVKTNAFGELQWQKAMGGTGADLAEDVLENKDGYLVLGFAGAYSDGDLQGTGCNSDFWLAQLNFNGEIMWQECYGGSGIDVPKKMIASGDYYTMVGSTSSTDGDVTNHHGYEDMWVIQVDGAGTLQWQKTLGGSSSEVARDVYFNSAGSAEKLVIIGSTHSSDGDVSFNHGGLDYWLVTLDAGLNIITEKTFGGSVDDEAYSILPSGNGTFIISGTTQSSDGDVTGFNGGADAWAIQVDLSGNLIWNKSVGGSKGDVCYASVGSDNGNDFILAGWTNSNKLGVYQGGDDLWIVKLGEKSSATGIEPSSGNTLKIFPNPGTTTTTFYLESSLTEAERLIVRNISGQSIYEKVITDKGNIIEFSIPNYLPGTYIVELQSPLGVQVGKFIVL